MELNHIGWTVKQENLEKMTDFLKLLGGKVLTETEAGSLNKILRFVHIPEPNIIIELIAPTDEGFVDEGFDHIAFEGNPPVDLLDNLMEIIDIPEMKAKAAFFSQNKYNNRQGAIEFIKFEDYVDNPKSRLAMNPISRGVGKILNNGQLRYYGIHEDVEDTCDCGDCE